jgi:putative redox protein
MLVRRKGNCLLQSLLLEEKMDAKVTWKSALSFEGSATSGYSVPLGTDPELGGNNDGFRPLELMAVSLAGCTAMDVISILQKKKQEVIAFEVKVHADRAGEHPKIFTRMLLTYWVSGHSVDEVAVRRAIELSATKYCAAMAMLRKSVLMEMNYEIYEESKGKNTLTRQGTFYV